MFTLEFLYAFMLLNFGYGFLSLYCGIFEKEFSFRTFRFNYSISNNKWQYLRGFINVFVALAILVSLPTKIPEKHKSFIGYWKGKNGNVIEIKESGLTSLLIRKSDGETEKYHLCSILVDNESLLITMVLFSIKKEFIIEDFPENGLMTLNNVNYINLGIDYYKMY